MRIAELEATLVAASMPSQQIDRFSPLALKALVAGSG
jgi:hypothetical protein